MTRGTRDGVVAAAGDQGIPRGAFRVRTIDAGAISVRGPRAVEAAPYVEEHIMSYLRKGVAGEPVRILQAKLGVTADGDFGPGTEKALKEYQSAHGLAADGIAGPDTFMAMGLSELVLLGVGSKGATVKKLQEALGISADGVFGQGTKKAVMAFQEKNGLDVDGFAGPATLSRMTAFAAQVTEVHVAAAELPAGAVVSGEPLPAAPGADAPAEAPPKKSVWGTVKGWFS